MDPLAIGMSADPAPSEGLLKGQALGPAPDGTGILVEISGQVLSAKGDPATPTGSPLLLARGPDGSWNAVRADTSAAQLAGSLQADLLAQLLESLPESATPELPARLRQALATRPDAVVPAVAAANPSPEARPLLLRAMPSGPLPAIQGDQLLEIEGARDGQYLARLGGRAVRLQGPEGLSGSQGLWRALSEGTDIWLVPARPADAPTNALPALPARVEPSAKGIEGFLMRLLPETLGAGDPELSREVRELAKLLEPVLANLAHPDADGGNAATASAPLATTSSAAARPIDARVLLRLLEAWCLQEEVPEAPAERAAQLEALAKGPVAHAETAAELLPAFVQQAMNAPDTFPRLAAWARHAASRVRFPLGESSDEAARELALAVAREIASRPPDAPELPQLRRLGSALLGEELQARQDLSQMLQLPWMLAQAPGWEEGTLRVLDRRRSRTQDGSGRHAVEVTLQPEGLGRVEARLELNAKHLRVTLTAQEPGTRQQMHERLSELSQRLQRIGLTPDLSVGEAATAPLAAVPTKPQRLDLQA